MNELEEEKIILMALGNQNGQTRTFNRTSGSGGISGEVIAKDDKGITVKLRDGGSKIVFYSGKTLISKTASSTIDGVTIGERVMIVGTSNVDGSVSAESIQLR